MPPTGPITLRIPVERHRRTEAVTVQIATPAAAAEPPGAGHDCRHYLPVLQTVRRGHKITGQRYRRDTVALCPVCARPWRVVTGAQHGTNTFTWLPIRPWNTRARTVLAGLLLDLLETAP